jgi:CheY-like chemotaxis protein/HPt (histidine-containing phosphotransfer) domain-containing protein
MVTLSIRKKEIRGENLIFQVSVKDTGIGIRKEDIDKLALSFERLEEKRNRHIEGTGLGISIVTRLLEMMNSKLRVESEYGKGSVFSFELALRIADAAPIGKYKDRCTAGARAADEANKLMAFNANVLITDDNEMNLKVASNFMKLFGINAETCTSGEETIELMRKNKYDILFLDHMMPKMDGIETLEILKRENLVPAETVVIALTANAVVGAKEQYLSVGFNDYLSKPIELKDLEKMLRKYLPQDMWKMEGNKEIGEISKNEINTDDKMSSFVKLGLNTEEGMAYCGGEEDFYIEIIGDYSKACEANIEKLENFKSQGDFENYKVLIHSVKSASKTIGSKELFNEAFELEKASGRGDKEFVEKNHDAFMKKYKKLADELNNVIQP